MAIVSRLSSAPTAVAALLKALLTSYPTTSQSLAKPRSILWIIFALWIAKGIKKLVASTYFFTGVASLSDRSHEGLPAFHKRYGKVARIAPELVTVADKDMIREILVMADYPKSIVHQGFELNNQHNLFSSQNKDFHKNRLRLVAPAFGLSYLRSLEPIMHECIGIMLQKVDELLEDPRAVKGKKVLPKGQINICLFMLRLSQDIIGETAFGQSFEMVKDDVHPVPGQMARTLERCMQQAFNPWMKYFIPLDFSSVDFGAERVKVRQAAGEKGRRGDLLQYLIDAQANERASEWKWRNWIAGLEASSTAMTFTLLFLVQNQDKLAKLREELDLATASNAPRTLPSYDQVRNLPYLTGCINESLRLRPVATIDILLAQLPLHWPDEYFPQADKYIPERWIPEESPFPPVQDFTFYPFSAGTRNCVGKNFAMMEMRLILWTLILTYDIGLVPNQREDYVQYVTTALATESYNITMTRKEEKRDA
ncbi:hypothetical protein BGZ74_011493 [Mortierella antarctica]|nr:hypothetical protein BGZ74_011493 [Mortierella antarctica]